MKFDVVFEEQAQAFAVTASIPRDTVEVNLGCDSLELPIEFQQKSEHMSVQLAELPTEIDATVENLYIVKVPGGDPYEGDYTVVPQIEQQILPTQYKVMERNLTVLGIPYAEVSNPSGGKTVTIGPLE